MAEPEIIVERRGAAGLVTLNRPHALNAVTLGMVRALAAALDAWEHDPAVTRIVVSAAGERAFSAGGDIRALYDQGRAGDHAGQCAFWREEYQLNRRIKLYPKPYVALIDGIVMGGGVGLAIHGAHRVAGDRFAFAMPEVGIGFFPDVGATYFLPRLPGRVGTYLALTGARVKAGDGLALGLATAYAPSVALGAISEALCSGAPIDEVLAAHAAPAPPAALEAARATIDACFDRATVADIIAALERDGSAFARETLAAMAQKAPVSLAIAHEQMRIGATLTIDEAMRTEFRIVWRLCRQRDFVEGIRAAIIDKDDAPRFSPAPADVGRYFAPLAPVDELAFPADA